MSQELEGQMALFDLDGCSREVQAIYADEVCDECGGECTSSKECVEISGLYDEYGLEET